MSMIDFPFLILFLTIASGAIWLVDTLFFAKKRKENASKDASESETLPLIADYAKSLFPVFLIVYILRAFVGQLFIVPSGSLEPTVVPGDYIFVTQYSYGLRLPIWHKKLLSIGEPKLGDIAVFHWPVNPRIDYIKRVVGVPGDKVSYINKVLYINGVVAKQKFIQEKSYGDSPAQQWMVHKVEENLKADKTAKGVKHDIYICPASSTGCPGYETHNFYNLVIPKGQYLMMGDNRDDSDDGRFWGLVSDKYLLGKARMVVLSWNSNADWGHKIRWSRIGKRFSKS